MEEFLVITMTPAEQADQEEPSMLLGWEDRPV